MIQKNEIFMPKYMKRFKCIGPYCEDTCCAGWSIPIDKETYQKYQCLMERENNIFKGRLQLVDTENDMNYACTSTEDGERCTFLNDKNLCDIQCQYGEEFLSSTCYHYPRVYNIVDGIYEKSAKLSCPEAARLILMQRGEFEFLEAEEEVKSNQNIKRIYDSFEYEVETIENSFFWEIRSALINVFNNSDELLSKKIWLAKYLITELKSKWDKNEDVYGIEKFIEEVQDLSTEKEADFSFNDTVYIDYEKIINFLWDISKNSTANTKLKHKINEILDNKNSIEEYNQNLDNNEYEYIYKNLIINSIFMNLFPLNSYSDVLIGLDKILEKYFLFKSIISLAKQKQNEKEIIELIQVFYKSYEHNIEFNRFYEKKISEVMYS